MRDLTSNADEREMSPKGAKEQVLTSSFTGPSLQKTPPFSGVLPFAWLILLFSLGVFLGTGGGAWLLHNARAWFHSPGPAKALTTLSRGLPSGATLCANVRSSELNGAFRELDCLITFRRAFPTRGKTLNRLILKKFRKLHKRLQTESADWRTVARWKFLYLLSTRLYPVRNKWAENAKIPVYEVNGHHLAVPFWIKESKRRKVGPLFHFDTHNDMRAVPSPKDLLEAVRKLKHNRDVKNAWHTISHAIYDCAMPVAGGVLTSGYRRVIWAKPGWNGYPEFLNRPFFFGRPKSGVPVAIVPKGLSSKKHKKKSDEYKAFEKKRSHFRLYYDVLLEAKKNPRKFESQDAWVEIQQPQRPVASKFELFTPFTFTILTTDIETTQTGGGRGAKMFQRLLKAIPPGPFTLDLDLDYFASIDSAEDFKRKAGSDPEWDLDKFAKRRKILKKHLHKFKNLLLSLKSHRRVPSVITIADSTYMTFAFDPIAEGQSEYTPIEHTAHLSRAVRKIFKEVYGKSVIGGEPVELEIPLVNSKKGKTSPRKARQTDANKRRTSSLKPNPSRKVALKRGL